MSNFLILPLNLISMDHILSIKIFYGRCSKPLRLLDRRYHKKFPLKVGVYLISYRTDNILIKLFDDGVRADR